MKNVAVLFFGGEIISVTLATEGVNGTHIVKGRGEYFYSGIVNGDFVDPDELGAVFAACIKDAYKTAKNFNVNKIYVGVPPYFTSAAISSAEITYPKPRKITVKDIQHLLCGGRAIYYKIDNGNAIIDALGYTAHRLEAQISRLVIKDSFIKQVGAALAGTRLSKAEFIPTVLAEAVYLIDEEIRDSACVLISCGMFTTSVAVIAGDELASIATFEMGLAHAINDVSIVMKISYPRAKEMVTDPNLFIKGGTVKEIIKARLEDMAERIYGVINKIDKKLFKKPFYICGGYVDAFPGARELFEKAFDVQITHGVCPYTEKNIPDDITRDAVINFALR